MREELKTPRSINVVDPQKLQDKRLWTLDEEGHKINLGDLNAEEFHKFIQKALEKKGLSLPDFSWPLAHRQAAIENILDVLPVYED
jgi:hypothetical protein